jgi:hypothetical protein
LTAAVVFAAALAFTAFLAAPRPTQAQTAAAPPPEQEVCEVFEGEGGSEEEVEEDCEGEEEIEAGAEGGQPPEECLLRSARARLVSSAAQNRVKLAVNYTAFAPTDAYIDYELIGGRGTLESPAAHQRLAEKGTFTLSRRLDGAEMEKARAARRVTVFLDVPSAPPNCRPFEIRHLTTRRSLHSQVVWLQPGTIFGANS